MHRRTTIAAAAALALALGAPLALGAGTPATLAANEQQGAPQAPAAPGLQLVPIAPATGPTAPGWTTSIDGGGNMSLERMDRRNLQESMRSPAGAPGPSYSGQRTLDSVCTTRVYMGLDGRRHSVRECRTTSSQVLQVLP